MASALEGWWSSYRRASLLQQPPLWWFKAQVLSWLHFSIIWKVAGQGEGKEESSAYIFDQKVHWDFSVGYYRNKIFGQPNETAYTSPSGGKGLNPPKDVCLPHNKAKAHSALSKAQPFWPYLPLAPFVATPSLACAQATWEYLWFLEAIPQFVLACATQSLVWSALWPGRILLILQDSAQMSIPSRNQFLSDPSPLRNPHVQSELVVLLLHLWLLIDLSPSLESELWGLTHLPLLIFLQCPSQTSLPLTLTCAYDAELLVLTGPEWHGPGEGPAAGWLQPCVLTAIHLCFEASEISVPHTLPEPPTGIHTSPKAQGGICSGAQSSRKRQRQ